MRHVIQAEFALNVVAHQHRIGRASRAGGFGYATNFYSESAEALVESILSTRGDESANAAGSSNSVQQAFSRRRGFRAKIKKQKRREAMEI